MDYLKRTFLGKDERDFQHVVVPLGSDRRQSNQIKAGDDPNDVKSDDSTSSIGEKSSQSQASGKSSTTLESLRAEIEADVAAEGHNTAYDHTYDPNKEIRIAFHILNNGKSKVINKAIQDMGMGTYQWKLFTLCGFGWMADNLWLQGVALTLDPIAAEFGINSNSVRYTTLALFTGLCIGASFWGIISDIIGRRHAFNMTLFLAGSFGLAAGGANSWIAVCALYACIGLGVGGNLPVDGALFLEFLPGESNYLLTLLSIWWPVGQLISSLLAWAYVPNFSCAPDAAVCNKVDNWGWRYFVLTLGALTFLMFIIRCFVFDLFESPKFLLSRGRQVEAVHVIQGIADANKTTTWLTEDILNQIDGDPDVTQDHKLSTQDIIKRGAGKFSTERIGPLFNGWKLGATTCLIWFAWTTIGMGYPLFNAFLPQYLAMNGAGGTNSASTTYRNYAITSIVGVPGSFIACYTVNVKYIGRKGTMAIATAISGMFLFLFTTSTNSGTQLAFSSLEAFFQNGTYGVLYAYTPEVLPAPNRGTGTGIASFFNRLAGLCAPIVAVNAASANLNAPIYASGGLFFAAFVALCLLPIETRGKHTL